MFNREVWDWDPNALFNRDSMRELSGFDQPRREANQRHFGRPLVLSSPNLVALAAAVEAMAAWVLVTKTGSC